MLILIALMPDTFFTLSMIRHSVSPFFCRRYAFHADDFITISAVLHVAHNGITTMPASLRCRFDVYAQPSRHARIGVMIILRYAASALRLMGMNSALALRRRARY